jgi:hypothetical protein
MKRIVNGVAYDTDKSTVIARAEYEWEIDGTDRPCEGTLYRTQGGAFFELREIDTGETDSHGGKTYKFIIEPMSERAAHKWVLEGNVELVDETFIEVADAVAEPTEPLAVIYLRVPPSLKRRVDEVAKAREMSVNAFVVRALEVEVEAFEPRGA